MPRRRITKTRTLTPDPVYNSSLIHTIVNHLMKKGKKSLAYKIIYDAMKAIQNITQKDPVKIIEEAVQNATPAIEVKAKRIGGSTYQIPLVVNSKRGTTLGIRWLLSSSRSRPGKSMISKITHEFIDASKKKGAAVQKRTDIKKIADANKVFGKYQN